MKLNTAKKLTAGALALSMMFAMATPAFAATNIGGDVKVGQGAPNEVLTIAKKYAVNAGSFEGDTVNLQLVAFEDGGFATVTDSTATDADAEALLPTFTANTNATATNASISMKLPNYTKVGTYTYKVKEVDGGTLGMTYDQTTYTLKIRVGNKMVDGKIDPSGEKVCYVTMRDADKNKKSAV